MRKMAYCPNCKQRRAIEIVLVAFKRYRPLSDDVMYCDTYDGEIECSVCTWTITDRISRDDLSDLLAAAYEAI